ncbi:MAG TPA: ArsR family transcriptional regulator [Gammaproteobacteria bacterium]|nr:ArsR family transcriptional regulator [Gammaproteobacteria bacterium]
MTSIPDCAQLLKSLSDDTRLTVLRQLMSGPKRVAELNADIGAEQSLFSHHLRILRERGLVVASREGKGVSYRLAPGVKKRNALNLGCCELRFG